MEGDAVPQKEAVPESERLPEAHAVSLGAAVPVFSAVEEGVPLALVRGVPEPVSTAVPLLVREGGALVAVAPSEGLPRGDEEPQTEGGGDSDAAPLAERVAGGERVLAAHATVGVATAVALGEPLCVGVKVARGEAEEDTVAVPDAEAEGEPVVERVLLEVSELRADAETEPVSEGEDVTVGERVALPEAEGVGEEQRVADEEGVNEWVTEPDPE